MRHPGEDDGHGRRHGDLLTLDERQQSARVVGFGEGEGARRHARRHPDQQPRAPRHRRENADVVFCADAQSRAVCAGEAHLRPLGPFAQLRKAAGAARDRDHGNLIEAESPGGHLLHRSFVLGRPGQPGPGEPPFGGFIREVDAKGGRGSACRLIRPGGRRVTARFGRGEDDVRRQFPACVAQFLAAPLHGGVAADDPRFFECDAQDYLAVRGGHLHEGAGVALDSPGDQVRGDASGAFIQFPPGDLLRRIAAGDLVRKIPRIVSVAFHHRLARPVAGGEIGLDCFLIQERRLHAGSRDQRPLYRGARFSA